MNDPAKNFRHILQSATLSLASITDSPKLEAEILLSLATSKSRSHFFAWPENEPAAAELEVFQSLLKQRLSGLPIAYISGSREFWSREFRVTADTLIPRPETELLVELALQRMPPNQTMEIADLGTGSGIIGITLALERPLAQVTALDFSPAALAVAKQNAEMLGANSVRFVESDWFTALDKSTEFDLIVSNPPYIAADDLHLQQGDVRFEPLTALAAGADGLADIRHIVLAARGHLKPGAWLLFEHGYDQGTAARALLETAGYTAVQTFQDLQGHDRVSAGCRVSV